MVNKKRNTCTAAMLNNSFCFDFDWEDVKKQNREGVTGHSSISRDYRLRRGEGEKCSPRHNFGMNGN